MSWSRCRELVRMSPRYSLCAAGTGPALPSYMSLGEADDGVERRAQLVGHVGEELALEAVGLLHAAVLLLQLLVLAAQLFFETFLFSDVAGGGEHTAELAHSVLEGSGVVGHDHLVAVLARQG